MQTLMLEAATDESARTLCAALSRFNAELDIDEHGRPLVFIRLGDDELTREVLDAIRRFMDNGEEIPTRWIVGAGLKR